MEMLDTMVSAIVPVYNVAPYLSQCVLSLQNQTYGKIEIILVDDGSTDESGEICDKLAFNDQRIVVIHKENQGVSSARNAGIDRAKGDYITFIDGDDFVAPDYIQYLLSIVEKTGADFCLSKNHMRKKNDYIEKEDNITVFSSRQATAFFLSPDITVYSPNNIIRIDIIKKNNLKFSEELFYGEGLTFVTSLAMLCSRIGVGNKKVYYYRRNNTSSATSMFNINKLKNGEHAIDLIENRLHGIEKNIDNMLKLHRATFYLGAIVKILESNQKKEYNTEFYNWRKLLNKYAWHLLFKRQISIRRKLLLLGGAISPWLMAKLDKKRRKHIANQSF